MSIEKLSVSEQQSSMIRISVRTLVEFILRSGDIDDRTGGGVRDTEAMRLGSQLHRRIQAGMGEGYQAEVPLSMDFPCSMDEDSFPAQACCPARNVSSVPGETFPDAASNEAVTSVLANRPCDTCDTSCTFIICLEGRADGIVAETEQESALIDEIKGIFRPAALLEEPVPVHLAQAKCYAYMYAAQNQLKHVRVRMTYASLAQQALREEDSDGKRDGYRKGSRRSGGPDDQLKFFYYEYDFNELDAWFTSVLNEYKKWARFERRWHAVRDAAIKQTSFPYPYRDGQGKLMGDVYRTILRRKQLLIQAPTGAGKTLSCLFPAVRAVGEGKAERIFYLTAKTITRTAAWDAFAQLKRRGLRMKIAVLTAKEKICPLEEMACNPEACPYAKGHFDRINEAVFELINSGDDFDRDSIVRAAGQYRVCPYELSLDIASWMDAVICDYNYAFHPRSKLKRFFGEGVKGDYLFLVDEAHNLVDRGRGMYSASLVRENVLALRRMAKKKYPELVTYARRLAAALLILKKAQEGITGDGPDTRGRLKTLDYQPGAQSRILERTDINGAAIEALNLYGALENFFRRVRDRQIYPDEADRKQALDLYFELGSFLDTVDLLDEHYVIYTQTRSPGSRIGISSGSAAGFPAGFAAGSETSFSAGSAAGISVSGSPADSPSYSPAISSPSGTSGGSPKACGGAFVLRLQCVNPSANLQKCFEKGRSGILFSATMLPIDYYRSMLGTPESYAVYARSCFNPDNLKIMVGGDVSTRYTSRSPQTYSKIAEYILRLVSAKSGNYMIFFSSYKMLADTEAYFRLICPADVRLICQSPGMDEAEREAFLESFRRDEQTVYADELPDAIGSGETDAPDSALPDAAGSGGADAPDSALPDTAGSGGADGIGRVDAPGPALRTASRPGSTDEAGHCRPGPGTLVGFCVMGSIFGEGIDLRGESLIGAAIVGPGLPQVGPEQEVLRSWFDAQGQDGFRFAYQCPGMNKVLQAAGRVIRTEADRGVVLLLDERFTYGACRQMFPREWAGGERCTLGSVSGKLQAFWSGI